MLHALGVVVYSRTRRVRVLQESVTASDVRDAVRPAATAQKGGHPAQFDELPRQAPSFLPAAPAAPSPAFRAVTTSRAPSLRSELVLPSSEIERFSESRMYRHFCLLLARGAAIPVVENAVLSDTALHFEMPPQSPLKLGSMALLRSAWRAKRQAWLAIRLWRKQQQR